MYILRVVIFSLDELNLTRILTVFKDILSHYLLPTNTLSLLQ